MRLRNVHKQEATLILDGVGEVPFGAIVEVDETLGRALTGSAAWNLVTEDAAELAAPAKSPRHKAPKE